MGYTSRFTHLLGECRRQMNGAVVGSMRYYGTSYGLNYGVSLPTIRELAAGEGKDHNYAKYLYQQQVREIQLSALHIAQSEEINTDQELAFWAKGIINSEVAEEAAFALFQHVSIVSKWLNSDNELLFYTALLSVAKSKLLHVDNLKDLIISTIDRNINILNTAIITLLESYYTIEENRIAIKDLLSSLPPSLSTDYITSEMVWRMDCCE